MNRHLFVYGTLRLDATSRYGHAQRARLAREGRSLGAATVQGRLYDLGRYPGLIDSSAATDLVHGELIALEDPARSLAWLDAYEGIRPGIVNAEYRREERPVALTCHDPLQAIRDLSAWVYIYARVVSAARLIADGRWPG